MTTTVLAHPTVEDQILDGALAGIARWGVDKTTMADVAKLSGSSRASLYRAFPGGRDQLLAELARRELGRFFADVVAEVDQAEDLEQALVAGISESIRWVRGHAGLQFVVTFEAERLLPFLGFGQVDRLYRAAGVLAGPCLARFVPAGQATWAAEWLARIVISLLFDPMSGLDAADPEQVRPLVRRYLVPALTTSLDQ